MQSIQNVVLPNSPAAALRRLWLGQSTQDDTNILITFLEWACSPSGRVSTVPPVLIDEQVRERFGLTNKPTVGLVLETIYRDHIPADTTPLFGFAAALAVDALTDGETNWAATWKETHGAFESQLAAADD